MHLETDELVEVQICIPVREITKTFKSSHNRLQVHARNDKYQSHVHHLALVWLKCLKVPEKYEIDAKGGMARRVAEQLSKLGLS